MPPLTPVSASAEVTLVSGTTSFSPLGDYPAATPERLIDGAQAPGSPRGGYGTGAVNLNGTLERSITIDFVQQVTVTQFSAHNPINPWGFARVADDLAGPWATVTITVSPESSGPLTIYDVTDQAAGRYFRIGVSNSGGNGTSLGEVTCNELTFEGGEPAPPPSGHCVTVLNPTTGAELVTICGIRTWFRAELNGPGSWGGEIYRGHADATPANFQAGNIFQITYSEIHTGPIFEGILEDGDLSVISADEEGGEIHVFGGRGSLAVLENAVAGHERLLFDGNVFPEEGLWRWAADSSGAILRRLILEAQAHDDAGSGASLNYLPLLNLGGLWNDDTHDSLDDVWDVINDQYEIPIQTDLLSAAFQLIRDGQLILEMRPDEELWAYNVYNSTFGRTLTSSTFAANKVRFVKGVNIGAENGAEIAKATVGSLRGTTAHVKSKDGYAWYDAPGATARGKEVALDLSHLEGTDAVQAAVDELFDNRAAAQEALLVPVVPPLSEAGLDDAAGWYYPGPSWADNGKYWIGDTVTLHTGSADFDYTDQAFRIVSVLVSIDETDTIAPVIVGLNAPFPDTESTGSGSSAGGAIAGAGSALPPASVGGGSVNGGVTSGTQHFHNQYILKVRQGIFDIADHGATATSASTGLTNAIGEATTHGGGNVDIPPGEWIIDNALQDTGAFNGQILLPNVSHSDPHISIVFRGHLAPGFHPVYGSDPLDNTGYSILRSTLTGASGTAAVFSAGNNLAIPSSGGGNNLTVGVQNLVCMGPNNPTFSFWNLAAAQPGPFNVQISTPGAFAGTPTEPTNTNAVAMKFPTAYFSNGTPIGTVAAGGFYVGVRAGELMTLGNLILGPCIVGLDVPELVYTGAAIGRLTATSVQRVIRGLGASKLDILAFINESTTGGASWLETLYHVDDSSNFLDLFLRHDLHETGGGADTLRLNGGSGVIDGGAIGSAWAGASSSLTVEDEGTPLATDAATLDFVGSPVTASGTGATKTITVRSNEPVTTNPGSGPDLVWEGDDLVMEWVD